MTSPSLKDTIRADLHAAMRERDAVRAGTLRMALTGIANAEVAGSSVRELSDEEILAVLAKEAKKRKEAASAYTAAQRPELAGRESAELAVLEAYLPRQLTDAQLAELVTDAVAEVGASGMAQMGAVMKTAQAKVAGRAEGARVAAVVRAALAG